MPEFQRRGERKVENRKKMEREGKKGQMHDGEGGKSITIGPHSKKV